MGPDVLNEYDAAILHDPDIAYTSGYLDLVTDNFGKTPMRIAALLKKGANPNNLGQCLFAPLIKAVCFDHIPTMGDNEPGKCMALLLDAGANPDIHSLEGSSEGETPLILLIRNDDCYIQSFKLLLEKGADPNFPDALGKLPLEHLLEKVECSLYEANFKRFEKLKILLESGAKVDLVSPYTNLTAYQIAQQLDNQEIMALFNAK